MRPLIPVLVLSAAVPALCQTPPEDASQAIQIQPQFKSSAEPWVFQFNPGQSTLRLRIPAPRPKWNRLDEQIIHRPPQGAFAEQKPQTPLNSRIYPDLRLLPTETARMEPIPVYFPKAKVEPIPLSAPDAKMVPIWTAMTRPDQKK